VGILARDADSSSRKDACLRADTHRQAKGAKKDRSQGFLGDLCDLGERPGLVLTHRQAKGAKEDITHVRKDEGTF
jgi:hypothetical protein